MQLDGIEYRLALLACFSRPRITPHPSWFFAGDKKSSLLYARRTILQRRWRKILFFDCVTLKVSRPTSTL